MKGYDVKMGYCTVHIAISILATVLVLILAHTCLIKSKVPGTLVERIHD